MTDLPGFADPVLQSQASFRALLDAMARPGSVHPAAIAGPAPLAPATAAVLLTLIDADTSLALPDWPDVRDWTGFHCGNRGETPVSQARFVVAADMPDLSTLDAGSDAGPEESATLILQVGDLEAGHPLRLSGPGLKAAFNHLGGGGRRRVRRRLGGQSRAVPAWDRPHPLRRIAACRLSPKPADRGRLMAYVAVKGGEQAIDAAHAWLAADRRGDPALAELSAAQIDEQLGRAVDRVMAEGALYDRGLAAIAVRQSQGDLTEASFLLRAYRTTLPRLAVTTALDTGAMQIRRRISAVFKDLPGGQVLGPTTDYTHRLLDFAPFAPAQPAPSPADPLAMPRVGDILAQEGLMEGDAPSDAIPGDLTREPLAFPADRALRLQALARGDEGFLLALGYSSQRGWGGSHPFVGEIRVGEVAVEIVPPELGFAVEIGDITVTECQMVNQFAGSKTVPPQFTRGYGLAFGHNERKAMAMALADRAMRAGELGEDVPAPRHRTSEFMLYAQRQRSRRPASSSI